MDSENVDDVPSNHEEEDIKEIHIEQFEPGNGEYVEVSYHNTDSTYWTGENQIATSDLNATLSQGDVILKSGTLDFEGIESTDYDPLSLGRPAEEALGAAKVQKADRCRKQHGCADCAEVFPNTEALNKHLLVHTACCGICNKSFAGSQFLRRHMEERHGYVGIVDRSPLAIVSYPKKRTGVRPEDLQQQHTVVIRCDQCGDLVAGSADLREHVKNKHGQQAAQDAGPDQTLPAFWCAQCGRRFSSSKALCAHERIHPEFVCGECGSKHVDGPALRRHHSDLPSHAPVPRGRGGVAPSCEQCEHTFRSRQDLAGHECDLSMLQANRKKKQEEKLAQQRAEKEQNKKLTDSRRRKRQAAADYFSLREDNEPYACAQCGMPFLSRRSMLMHERSHGGKFVCLQCCSSHDDGDSLREHQRKNPDHRPCVRDHGGGPVRCKHCQYVYLSRMDRDRHECSARNANGKASTCRRALGEADADSAATVEKAAGLADADSAAIVEKAAGMAEADSAATVEKAAGMADADSAATLEKAASSADELRLSADSEEEEDGEETDSEPEDDVEKPHACDMCKATFCRADSLQRHCRTHTGKRPYKCDECGADFSGIDNLNRHRHTHSNQPVLRLRCEPCGRDFSTETQWSAHPCSQSAEQSIRCIICSESFTSIDGWRQHRHSDAWDKVFACDFCGDVFHHFGFLRRHKKVIHQATVGSGDQPQKDPFGSLECSACSRMFGTSKGLRQHIRRHKCEAGFRCFSCGDTFDEAKRLRQHVRQHLSPTPFKCGTCGVGLETVGSLRKHRLRMHPGEVLCMCETCGATFDQVVELRKHELAHAMQDVVSKKCPTPGCGAAFPTKNKLRCHVLMSHSEDRPYICAPCGASFVHVVDLRRHERTHEREKELFHCDDCTSSFGAANQLAAHRRAAHGVVAKDRPKADEDPDPVAAAASSPATSVELLEGSATGQSGKPDEPAHANPEDACSGDDDVEDGEDGGADVTAAAPRPAKRPRLRVRRRYRGPMTFECSTCGTSFPDVHTWRAHEVAGTCRPPGATLSCDVCGTLFCHRKTLDTHRRMHRAEASPEPEAEGSGVPPEAEASDSIDEEEKPYTCGHCPAAFASVDDLRIHERSHPEAAPQAVPEAVPAAFDEVAVESASDAEDAEGAAEGVGVRPPNPKIFSCAKCPTSYASLVSLRRHIVTQAHAAEPSSCKDCGVSFPTIYDLYRHVEANHVTENIFMCGMCGESFDRRRKLRSHLTHHRLSERASLMAVAFCCAKCNKAFGFEAELLHHVLSPACPSNKGHGGGLTERKQEVQLCDLEPESDDDEELILGFP